MASFVLPRQREYDNGPAGLEQCSPIRLHGSSVNQTPLLRGTRICLVQYMRSIIWAYIYGNLGW
jgi:hypothetical protein